MSAEHRRSFGSIDDVGPGLYRARYTDPDGVRQSQRFRTKADARVWLAAAQADIARRTWASPQAESTRTVGDYADDYLSRADLRSSTRELYEGVWRLHLQPSWANVRVRDVTPMRVRQWHERAGRFIAPTALVQSYRLLRALMNVAVADEVVATNPCRVRGAGVPKPARASRSLSVEDVQAIADNVPDRYAALILALAYGGLRFGEATALRRMDLSADASTIRVSRSAGRRKTGWEVGPPKSDAGRREVSLPASVAMRVRIHLARFVSDSPDALVFGTSSGSFLANSSFHPTFQRAVTASGLEAVRIHELRHTGATLAAQAGATTADLMHRLGHSSSAAAMIYQHATAARDRHIAASLDGLMQPPSTPGMELGD